MRRLEAAESQTLLSAVTARGEVIVEGHAVGHVEGFAFRPDADSEGEARRLVLRAARRALSGEMPRRVSALVADEDAAFALTDNGEIMWHGAAVGRLRRGHALLHPAAQPLASEFLDGAQRERLRQRLQAFVEHHIRAELAPLFAARDVTRGDATLRGVLHRLVEHAGVSGPMELAAPVRAALKRVGARAGRFGVYLPELLKPRAMKLRAQLWAIAHGSAMPVLPAPSLISIAPPPSWDVGFAAALGWVEAGPVLLRLDIAEKMAAELAYAARRGAVAVPVSLASRLSVKAEQLPAVLRALGMRLLPPAALEEGMAGPPAPAMMMTRRPVPRAMAEVPAPIDARPASGPFAALAALRK